MWNIYFGEWGTGRLKRLPYVGYHILLMVLVFAVIFGSVALVGSLENVISGSVMQMQAAFLEKFGILTLLGVVLFFFAIRAAQVNLLAKRLRDMGLPVLWTILGMVALSLLLNNLFPAQHVEISSAMIQTAEGTSAAFEANASESSLVVKLYDLAVFLCLVLIPSDTFNRQKHQEG